MVGKKWRGVDRAGERSVFAPTGSLSSANTRLMCWAFSVSSSSSSTSDAVVSTSVTGWAAIIDQWVAGRPGRVA
jgi:hypothetical protein